MEVLFPSCCGLDVHQKKIVACCLTPGSKPKGEPVRQTRTFGTMTDDLLALSDWLAAQQVTHVAMESTGVYWKPIYNLLEGVFELLVVNAAHIKAVPGRKTDVNDAQWIADLLRHGLLRGSFVPDRPRRELRELTRYRVSLVRERAAEVNRLQKVLEGANIKLSSVASDITGVSGREILAALVSGQKDAQAMAQLARGRMREKIPELERALVGRFAAHQRFLVARQLAHVEALDEFIDQINGEIAQRFAGMGGPENDGPPGPGRGTAPGAEEGAEASHGGPEGEPRGQGGSASEYEAAISRLQTIPGVGQRTAETLVSEIGIEMSRFPTHRHLAAWAGMAPGNNESAGKRKSGKTRKGSPWLRAILVEAAQAAGRTKETYLAAQYARLKARRGAKKAAIAVGHSILVIAYHLLKHQTTYEELGGNYFDERDRQAVTRRAVKRLEGLGYTVRLEAKAAA
jgi:transposase